MTVYSLASRVLAKSVMPVVLLVVYSVTMVRPVLVPLVPGCQTAPAKPSSSTRFSGLASYTGLLNEGVAPLAGLAMVTTPVGGVL
ncbi:hypothetical protein M1D52_21930 [Olivibacter sp. SA151]|uniref:hypothetical protein n=1 Tax=Olivibacter jilunii TaxID=985016 RepID=UPI003F158E98